MIRNCRNCAPTLFPLKKLGKDNSSLQSKKDPRLCGQHVENTHNLEILKTSRPRGWIRSNTKMGPVLDAKIYPHEGRSCVNIVMESLFEDQTVSWVRIVNGVHKYVTETSEEIPIENVQLFISTGGPVAKGQAKNETCCEFCLPITFLFVKGNG